MSEQTNRATRGSASASTATTAQFTLTVEHPCLTETDAASIPVFLRKYDQYSHELLLRARQIATPEDEDPVRPIDIKYCVDGDLLESSIDLGFIPGAESYKTSTSEQVRSFLDSRATESKNTITLARLEKIVEDELRTNMRHTDATAQM